MDERARPGSRSVLPSLSHWVGSWYRSRCIWLSGKCASSCASGRRRLHPWIGGGSMMSAASSSRSDPAKHRAWAVPCGHQGAIRVRQLAGQLGVEGCWQGLGQGGHGPCRSSRRGDRLDPGYYGDQLSSREEELRDGPVGVADRAALRRHRVSTADPDRLALGRDPPCYSWPLGRRGPDRIPRRWVRNLH